MKIIRRLYVCEAIIVLGLADCSPSIRQQATIEWTEGEIAKCVSSKPPTHDEIVKMPTSTLYHWWQLSRRASDQRATADVTGVPLDPCTRALAWKESEFEQELKYR